jgi:signal transduction histidine kinase
MVQNDIFIKNAVIIGLALAGLVVTMLFVVVRRTHKMYGPMVSIHRFLQELQKGNYAVRIAVRETDDFQRLVNELNSLAEALHERHPETLAGIDTEDITDRMESMEAGVVVVDSPRSKLQDISKRGSNPNHKDPQAS